MCVGGRGGDAEGAGRGLQLASPPTGGKLDNLQGIPGTTPNSSNFIHFFTAIPGRYIRRMPMFSQKS